MERLRRYFDIQGPAGVELRPEGLAEDPASGEDLAQSLRAYGFGMASLGVQSFSEESLRRLGRADADAQANRKALVRLAGAGFQAVDVDLIFGIPGQDAAGLSQDFRLAADLGATQISTYPFIAFSYANNAEAPLSHSKKKAMLDLLLKTAADCGFERDSVWTFKQRGSPRYSSVTRDNFVGFGPSASSLSRRHFKINTFSIEAYAEAVKAGQFPTALAMEFDERTRAAYWLFWRCYSLDINSSDFLALFGRELNSYWSFSLGLGQALGWLKKTPNGYALTRRGALAFHGVEQVYTHAYIDKTWAAAHGEPWPKGIRL
jgi:oxygen-independent coproporphyrinogen-3 oxidase